MIVVDKVSLSFLAAKQSKSPGELVRELVECGFSLSGDTRAFAEEIYARAPRKTPGVNVRPSMTLVLFSEIGRAHV